MTTETSLRGSPLELPMWNASGRPFMLANGRRRCEGREKGERKEQKVDVDVLPNDERMLLDGFGRIVH